MVTGSDLKVDDGGTENVTGRDERHRPYAVETVRAIELDRLDLVKNCKRLGLSVEGGHPTRVFAPLLEPLDLPFGVLFLYPSAIREEDLQQSSCWLRRQDATTVAGLPKQSQPARVVDVGMAEDHPREI